MGRGEQYRWFALRCLEIARATADEQTKAAMLQMAQAWQRLAEEVDAPSFKHLLSCLGDGNRA
jgi:hypothetical protein